MPRFPSKEAAISDLARTMFYGFAAHHDDFPSINYIPLLTAWKAYKAARAVQSEAVAAAQLATQQKNSALAELVEVMKSLLKKAEVDVCDAPHKLEYIGWGPKADPQPADPPAAPGNLVSLAEGPGTVILKWDSPVGGGPARNYIIEYREQTGGGPFGPWLIASSSLDNQANLTGQQRGIQLEYRVKAINTGGESPPSNTVVVML